MGALFRTADGAGVSKVYLTGYSPCPPHKAVDKVSLGAEKTMPWEYAKQAVSLVKRLKAAGYCIIALEQAPKSVSIYQWNPQFPLALIVGNEKTGVSPGLLKQCDSIVHLPMAGSKNSLNVSVAGGIALYYISSRM